MKPPAPAPEPRPPLANRLSQYFFRGLITFLPLAITVYVLVIFITWTERTAMQLLRPLTGEFYLPGLGIALGALLIVALGGLMSMRVTGKLLSYVELPFTNLPVVKSIYSSLKNFADYFAPHEQDAQQVVLLKMPGHELSTVGLVTRQSMKGLPRGLAELDDQVAVYLPMGYMIGGYTVFVPRSWTTPVDMSVEEAMRMALIAFMASNQNGKGAA
ncbi:MULTISPECIES: DUF502 domain-containing protein [Hydrogenophaga]|jgi:uncharacterized membrane protein|uniref:DUF502 domain-containing protein n=1 Tax=Hydrogenophaga pseudoflava TaxID=47421 RepID=A0A4V1AB32_HYDPS|nr:MULTISPECIES: DUF502 domain-containing protein [Hydrogenophaga]OPF65090.1 hypothetical protein BC358_00540 [Hydrogenophaga sp. H7]QBM26553.1 hypothetical protein HPF_02595 [Hydrogenophaga pseudoflava]